MLHFLPRFGRSAAACLLLVVMLPESPRAAEIESQALLAPTLPETRAAIEQLDRLAGSAEATALALFRVHNRFGELRSRAEGRPGCGDGWLVDLASRSRVLGSAFRDQAQSARAQAARAQRLMTAPTVQPLIDASTHYRAVQLFARIDVLERRYLEASVWQRTYVEAVAGGCATHLEPAEGIRGLRLPRADDGWEPPSPEPEGGEPATGEDVAAEVVASAEPEVAETNPEADAATEATDVPATIPPPGRPSQESPLLELGAIEEGPIAVIGIGGGMLCPPGEAADGVVVLDGPEGCWAPIRCDCKPRPLLPAAILGRVVPETDRAEELPERGAG